MTNIKKDYGLDNIDSLSNQEIYDYFIKSVGKHLHLIITMNPISNELRVKIRNYPSLVDCTNIIWYDNWPVEALVAVSE
jgi:dynein heavy chain